MGWSFFAFDWERFREIRPRLKMASESGDFSRIDWPEALDLFEHAVEHMQPGTICNELIVTMCAAGDPLFIEGGLPATILKLRKQANGEEPGDMLAEFISAAPGVEDWFKADSGLVGILSAPTVEELTHMLAAFKTDEPRTHNRGLAGIRRKLTTSDPPKDPLQSLIKLLEESASRGFGIAAYRV